MTNFYLTGDGDVFLREKADEVVVDKSPSSKQAKTTFSKEETEKINISLE